MSRKTSPNFRSSDQGFEPSPLDGMIKSNNSILLFLFVAGVFAVIPAPPQTASAIYSTQSDQLAPFDVIIKDGHILDGSGGPWYAADIGIRHDRIAAIGNLAGAQARTVVDATGQIVSPGFIDMLG